MPLKENTRNGKQETGRYGLKIILPFTFTVERMEDEDDAYYTDIAKHQLFRLGHIMKVIGIEYDEDDLHGIIVQVREGRKKGYVSLCDLEISARADRNFWSVREYVVWFANQA